MLSGGSRRLSRSRVLCSGATAKVDAHGYTLTFEILPDTAGASTLLHTSGYHLDSTSNLSLYVRQADIKQRLFGFSLNRPYPVPNATYRDDVHPFRLVPRS